MPSARYTGSVKPNNFFDLKKCAGLAVAILSVAACNSTRAIKVPEVSVAEPIKVERPREQQASFVLSKIVANIKRGTPIIYYPKKGFRKKGFQDHFATIDQGAYRNGRADLPILEIGEMNLVEFFMKHSLIKI